MNIAKLKRVMAWVIIVAMGGGTMVSAFIYFL